MTQGICSYPLFAFNYVTHAMCNSYQIFDLFDDAIADLLGLVTFRHGTSPSNMFSIIRTGAQPNYGGRKDMGEGAHLDAQGKTRMQDDTVRFFVAKDDCHRDNDVTFALCECMDTSVPFAGGCGTQIDDYRAHKEAARFYARQTTPAELRKKGYADCADSCGSILATFSPTLKFRFRPDQLRTYDTYAFENGVYVFNDDLTYKTIGVAAYTHMAIPTTHLGTFATLRHGLDLQVCQRLADDPERFTKGLYKLAWAVTLTALCVLGLTLSWATAVPVIAYFMYETAFFVGNLAVPLLSNCCCATPSLEDL